MIEMHPIGRVHTPRAGIEDDFWGEVASRVVLDDAIPADAFSGLDEFSHVEILFVFDRVADEAIVRGARRPRNNPDWPIAGIFAQRAKNRPNRIGATIARVVRVEGRELHVVGLDAADGSPVLDVKPVLEEFLPREPVRQPAWTRELMRDYWKTPEA